MEELQRNGSHKTTSASLNNSHSLSSTPQTTQSHTPQDRPRAPNRFLSQEEGVWFACRAEGCENGVMPISDVFEKLSSSQIENVLALKGYSGYRLCYFVPSWERFFVEDQGNALEDPGTSLCATHIHLNIKCLCVFIELIIILILTSRTMGQIKHEKITGLIII